MSARHIAPVLFLAVAIGATGLGMAPRQDQPDGIDRLVASLQSAIESGDPGTLRPLLAGTLASQDAGAEFLALMTAPRATGVTVKERDRVPTLGSRQRLIVEILTEFDREGRVSTWRLDVAPIRLGDPDAPWLIVDLEKLTVVSGLYRLALDGQREYDVRNLVVQLTDLTLTLPAGRAFVSPTHDGNTAIVLLGRGHALFSPKPAAERGQVKIFCGAEALNAEFDSLFLRLNPGEFDARIAPEALVGRAAVDARDLRRAQQVWEDVAAQSFHIDLADLSGERWWLIPSGDDAVAEIATRKFGSLTYTRSSTQPEDISFFDRNRRKNISVYASEARLAARGEFFDEDDLSDYDVKTYDITTTFVPERLWIDGSARLHVVVRRNAIATMTLRLADTLVVRSMTSPQFGRLLHLRVVGQNSVLVGFPGMLVAGTTFDIDVRYGGRLEPQALDREAVQAGRDQPPSDIVSIPPEPQWVYSNRSYWYPQGMVSDYSTAKMTFIVPAEIDVVASGSPAAAPATLPAAAGQRPRKQFVFDTSRPARYLAFLASRFQGIQAAGLDVPSDGEPFNLFVQANPRETNRSRNFADKTAEILKFYSSMLGTVPYPSLTVALTESDTPGGHSPAYMAMVNQPLPTSPFTWVNDPVAFQNYASFFLAHEVAHQWWGQAVGWKNYHEQWLSEGFAQYFAALFAEKERGPDQFTAVIRQMRKTAVDASPQGPVYLGYRLGHLRSEPRVFRALVYNKGAMVLHMLRRLIGDEAFFAGLRDFYASWRYKKAGTEDFRATMEKASGHKLERFFRQWIYDSAIPAVRFTSRVDGSTLHVHIEQKGDLYELPLTVTLTYADGSTEDVLVQVADKTVDRELPLKGALKSAEVNKDGGALVVIEK